MGCDARSSASNHMAIFVHMSTPLTWQTFHLLQWQTSDVFFCYFVATFDTLWFYRIVDVDDKMMECYLMLWNIPLIHSQEQSVLNNVNLLSWAGDQMMNVPLANISSLNPFKWQRIPKQVPKRWQKKGREFYKIAIQTQTHRLLGKYKYQFGAFVYLGEFFICLAYSQFPYVVWLWSHHQHQYINISTFLVVMGCFPLFSAGNTARFTSKHTFCVKWLSSIPMLSECSIYWRMNQLVFFCCKITIQKMVNIQASNSLLKIVKFT